jgi:2'-5' RNA ligase
MKTRFFFVIYLHNETIKAVLDGMRIIADPLQRNFSHITVKGPYRNIQKKRLNEDSKLIQGKEIKVLGAGNFFVDNQNTVFLKCEEKEELYTIWKTKEEKTYKEFHPHITIYDGDNRLFAKQLFDTINSHKINFSFVVDKLELYSSADKNKLFNLKHQVDYLLLSKIAGITITQENIDKLSNQKRVELIDKLCDILERVNDLLDDPKVSPSRLHEHSLLIEA